MSLNNEVISVGRSNKLAYPVWHCNRFTMHILQTIGCELCITRTSDFAEHQSLNGPVCCVPCRAFFRYVTAAAFCGEPDTRLPIVSVKSASRLYAYGTMEVSGNSNTTCTGSECILDADPRRLAVNGWRTIHRDGHTDTESAIVESQAAATVACRM